jgi:hypothetical protein
VVLSWSLTPNYNRIECCQIHPRFIILGCHYLNKILFMNFECILEWFWWEHFEAIKLSLWAVTLTFKIYSLKHLTLHNWWNFAGSRWLTSDMRGLVVKVFSSYSLIVNILDFQWWPLGLCRCRSYPKDAKLQYSEVFSFAFGPQTTKQKCYPDLFYG